MDYHVQEGETYYCFRTMLGADDKQMFIQEKTYTCEKDGALTNEQGLVIEFEKEEWAFDFIDLFDSHLVNQKDTQ